MTYIHYRQWFATLPPFVKREQLLQAVPECYHKGLLPHLEGRTRIDRYSLLDTLENGYPAFVIVIPSWNNAQYVQRNLSSVFRQNYPYMRVIYIDDDSTDSTLAEVHQVVEQYETSHKIRIIRQPERNRQACARFVAYHQCDDDEILCMLDGDDWFADSHSLQHVAKAYRSGAMATYGSYRRFENESVKPFLYGPRETFPQSVLCQRSFREYRWISQHLRTGYAGLFKRIQYRDLVDHRNQWFEMCTDLAETMPLLEMATPHIQLVPECTVIYNVDASNRHRNSYFRQKENPEAAEKRQEILDKIRTTPSYPTVSKRDLFIGRYLETRWCEVTDLPERGEVDFIVISPLKMDTQLPKVMDACGIDVCVSHSAVIRAPRKIFDKDTRIGILAQDTPISKCVVVSRRFWKIKTVPRGTLVLSAKKMSRVSL